MEKNHEDGKCFIGQFKNDQMNGNEEIYYGEFINGKREGKGRYYISKEYYYEGESKNNNFHGRGEFYSIKENRLLISANFENGNRNGEGVIYLSNGDIKIVEYKDDEEIGEAIKFIKDISISELFN